jgi:hypothetical protein
MKTSRYHFVVILVLLFLARDLYAHRPVIVKSNSSLDNPVLVEEPEISWAYYGILDGKDHYYEIVYSEPFNLYVNILVPDYNPDEEPIRFHDMSFQIFRDEQLLFTGTGMDIQWRRFYEEYGKDHYYWGPEFEQTVEAGTYYVRVFNSNNRGKYSLAIGKIEKFTFPVIVGAIFKAQSLDRWFFKEAED